MEKEEVKNICIKMYIMFYEFGCWHCPFAITDDKGNKICKLGKDEKPKDWVLEKEEGGKENDK